MPGDRVGRRFAGVEGHAQRFERDVQADCATEAKAVDHRLGRVEDPDGYGIDDVGLDATRQRPPAEPDKPGGGTGRSGVCGPSPPIAIHTLEGTCR